MSAPAPQKPNQRKRRHIPQEGLIDGKKFEDWPAWDGQGVPLRENCDLDNPRQKFLWMFTAMPGMKGAPLMLPPEYWEMQSWRMCVLGAGIVAEPALKWQAPLTTANPHIAAGKWVPPETPDPPRPTMKDLVAKLPQADRAELRGVVLDQLGLEDARPDTPEGHYRVTDLGKRLGLSVDEVAEILAKFGMRHVKPNSLISRDLAERIVVHLGL